MGRKLRKYLAYRRNMDKSQIRYDNTVRNLKKEGWKDIDFTIDLEYLEELGADILLKETANLLYNFVYEITHPNRSAVANLLSILARSENEYWRDYIQLITPNPVIKSIKNRNQEFKVSSSEGLNSYLLKLVVSYLGIPKETYQEIREGEWGNAPSTILTLPKEKFTRWEDLQIKGSVNLIFENGIEVEMWKANSYSSDRDGIISDIEINIYFPNKEIRSTVLSEALKGMTVIKTKVGDTVGKVNSKYKLSTFNKEGVRIVDQLRREVLKTNSSSKSEKLAMLLQGNPGVGKTSWVNAFVKEVVSPLGYLVINLDLESLSEYTPLPYIDKVCLVINDGDNLAIDRRNRSDGFTERVMSLLDGNYLNCIDPINNSTQKLLIFITANTIERWDEAALREGRIDWSYSFENPIFKDINKYAA